VLLGRGEEEMEEKWIQKREREKRGDARLLRIKGESDEKKKQERKLSLATQFPP
jgi:hypothetical protein